MRLRLVVEKEAKVITKKATPYEFNGKKGTSYVLGIRMENDLDEISCTEQLFDQVHEDDTYIFGGSVNTSYQNQKFVLDVVVSRPATSASKPSNAPQSK